MAKGEAEGNKRKSEGTHSQLVEAVQSREGPVGVLYCARDVIMVQLPVENQRKERGGVRKIAGRREKERGRPLPALERYTGLAEDGLEVTGYPFTIITLQTTSPSPLHLALRAPLPAL